MQLPLLTQHLLTLYVPSLSSSFERRSFVPPVTPASHAWSSTGDLMIGCVGGQLVRVDADSGAVVVLFVPNYVVEEADAASASAAASAAASVLAGSRLQTPSERPPRSGQGGRKSSPGRRRSSGGGRRSSQGRRQSTPLAAGTNVIRRGSLNHMALHSEGLFVGGDDGVARVLDISSSSNGIAILDAIPIGDPIVSMAFSPRFETLIIGSPKGTIFQYSPTQQNLTTVVCTAEGAFVGVAPLAPGDAHVVTVREAGHLQVWETRCGGYTSSMNLETALSSLACSPKAPFAVVGSVDGFLFVVDLVKVDKPRVVLRERMHEGSVEGVGFDQRGCIFCTCSDDGNIFVFSGSAIRRFEVLGFVSGVQGPVRSLSAYYNPENHKIRVAGLLLPNSTAACSSTVVVVDIPRSIVDDCDRFRVNVSGELKDEEINRMTLEIRRPLAALRVTKHMSAIAICDGEMVKLALPKLAPRKSKRDSARSDLRRAGSMSSVSGDDAGALSAPFESRQMIPIHYRFAGHRITEGAGVNVSANHGWVLTHGADGRIVAREIDKLDADDDKFLALRSNDFKTGGVLSLSVSSDLKRVFVSGRDGSLACFEWPVETRARSEASPVDQAEAEALMSTEAWRGGGGGGGGDEARTASPATLVFPETTWLEIRRARLLEEEEKQFVGAKSELRRQIDVIRKKLRELISANDERGDRERLGRDEFELDMDLKAAQEVSLQRDLFGTREQAKYDNLAKLYRREIIKQECWDDMPVKGRTLTSFKTSLEVTNYPMRRRTSKEVEDLAAVEAVRRVELAAARARRSVSRRRRSTVGGGNEPNAPGSKDASTDEDDDDNDDDDDADDSEPRVSTKGSSGFQFGGDSPLFYSQFQLGNRAQKLRQMVLLKDAVFRIRTQFNERFDEALLCKEQQIAKIREKNKRIRKIMEDLERDPSVVQDPSMGVLEQPEQLLHVADEEVKVERFLTAEMRRRLEENRMDKLDQTGEREDNIRQRALDKMMGGILEMKKEDELKKDIPKPAFMSGPNAKPEEEWTEDDMMVLREYERKCRELNDSRERHRKQLENELRKLEEGIKEDVFTFDALLTNLFLTKVKTDKAICEDQLHILRLRASLMTEDEIEAKEAELVRQLEEKREAKNAAILNVTEAKKSVDGARDAFDILVAEDKVMEKIFRREFSDCGGVLLEQLQKLFKKRPKIKAAATAMQAHSPGGLTAPGSNPYGERPSTARRRELAQRALDAAIRDLDSEAHMPDICPPEVWTRFCHFRRNKIESEQHLKQKVQTLSEMTAFVQRRSEEDDRLKNSCEEILSRLKFVYDCKNFFRTDLQVQLIVKQGQVEIDMYVPVYDFRSTVLVHRSLAEELNHAIKSLGQQKVNAMAESRDFRKGIVQFEWAHKRSQMRMEDLHSLARDIQMLKVTKQIQQFLNEDDYDAKRLLEVESTEAAMEAQEAKNKRDIKKKQKFLHDLQTTIETRVRQNSEIESEVEKRNVDVNERRQVTDAEAPALRRLLARRRCRGFAERSRLVELAKAKSQEVAVLRMEVERLRMRTFPALVQVEL